MRIRKLSADAPIIILNPVERADFVYINDPRNNVHGSYSERNGQSLAFVAKQIYRCCKGEGIYTVDLHAICGFNQENVIRYKHMHVNGGYQNLSYPDYVGLPFDPEVDEYPYPIEAVALTYDGLHPSDEGSAVIAKIVLEQIEKVL